jgi:predicted RND superfamily exporter protein
MTSRTARHYVDLVFGKPYAVITALLLIVVFFAWHAQDFRLDASADSLLLENDPDLEFSREINRRYGARDSVTVAYTPRADLFSRAALQKLGALRDELLAVEQVQSVDSVLNVPVFEDTPLTGISEDYLTLADEEIDLVAAREEIMTSPVFRNAVISPDGRTAGVLVGFRVDETSQDLLTRRSELRSRRLEGTLTAEASQELAQVESEYDEYSVVVADRQHETISTIRGILDDYRDDATIYLGGAPMIADDLVTFVRGDLSSFSFAVLILIVVALGLIFRKPRFVVMPLACCAVAGTVMVGMLGLMDWRVTVVSSNFISLLLIITISLTVHLMVRYRELRATRHYSDHDKLHVPTLPLHGADDCCGIRVADSQRHSADYQFRLDDDDGSSHCAAGRVHTVSRDHEHPRARRNQVVFGSQAEPDIGAGKTYRSAARSGSRYLFAGNRIQRTWIDQAAGRKQLH